MKRAKWPFIFFCILMSPGNFLGASEKFEPYWSDQIETHLVFTIVGQRQMIDAKLYYDREGNRIAVLLRDVSEDRKLSSEKLAIYRFGEETRLMVTGYKCQDAPNIERKETSIQFLEATPKGKRLKDFGSFFFFDPVKYATQVPCNCGKSFPNGTTKWESSSINIGFFGFQYCNLTHYLTDGNQESQEKNLPSSFLKIEGICSIDIEETSDEVPMEVEFLIDFFWSKNSISNSEILQQPPGVYCPFVNTTRSFPPLPSYFSFDIVTLDRNDELSNDVTSFRKQVWFDSSNKLLRRDDFNWEFDIHMTIIGDYNSRLSYVIYPSGECTINSLKEGMTMESGITLPGENFPLFPDSAAYSPQFVGKRKRFGITSDVWVNRKETEEVTEVSDYYFASNVHSEDNRNITYPTFIELFLFGPEEKIAGKALHLIGQYRTQPNVEDQSTFDVTACFPESNKTRFFLTFEGDVGSIDQSGLREKVRKQLLSSLNIDRMRMGSIEISYLDESSIVFYSAILEDFTILGYKQGKTGRSREEALKALSELISNRKLVISASTRDTTPKDITLTGTELSLPFSDKNNTADGKDSKPDKNDTIDGKDNQPDKCKKGEKSGFSGGALAGVGIAMLLVGLLQGIILLVAYVRYRRDDPLLKKLTPSEEPPASSPPSQNPSASS